MKNLKWRFHSLLFGIIIFTFGCKNEGNTPDITNITISPKFVEFDEAFLTLNPERDLGSQLDTLRNNYPGITDLYIENVMGFKRSRDTTNNYLKEIRGFLQSPLVKDLNATVDSVYPSLENLNYQFKTAFQYLKYYFPDIPTPNVYYLIDEYSYACFLFPDEENDGLGISLDMFLGSTYPYKNLFPTNPAFSDYLTKSFDRQYIIKKGIEVIVEDIVGFPSGPQMIDQMIINGKKQYILSKLLPETPDSILWEYSSNQMQWVLDNEINIYAFLLSEDLLYSSDIQKFQKFVNPSPNSPGMPEDAPGRTANFIGFKIIEAFMDNANQPSLEELINTTETQTILATSRYKPAIKQ